MRQKQVWSQLTMDLFASKRKIRKWDYQSGGKDASEIIKVEDFPNRGTSPSDSSPSRIGTCCMLMGEHWFGRSNKSVYKIPHIPWRQTNFNAKNDEEEEYLHKFFFHRCMFTSGKHCSFDTALTVGWHEAAILIVNKLYSYLYFLLSFLHCFTCLQHW